MHANVHSDRGGGSGGGSWRLPPDETLQVSDPKEKIDVSKHATYSISIAKCGHINIYTFNVIFPLCLCLCM